MKGVHYVLGHPFSMSMDWTPEGEGSRALGGYEIVAA